MFEIDMWLSDAKLQEIWNWCSETLDPRPGLFCQVALGHLQPNSGERNYVWTFTQEKDYVMFRLTWCYELLS